MPWWPISYLHLRSICAPVWLLKVTRTSSLSNELLWQWEDDSQCKHSFQKICPARHLKVLPCVWLIIWNCILYRLYPPLCPYVLFVSSFKLLTLILTISPNKLCYCHQSTDERRLPLTEDYRCNLNQNNCLFTFLCTDGASSPVSNMSPLPNLSLLFLLKVFHSRGSNLWLGVVDFSNMQKIRYWKQVSLVNSSYCLVSNRLHFYLVTISYCVVSYRLCVSLVTSSYCVVQNR